MSYNLNDFIAPHSGWNLTHATDINNNEWIIGEGEIDNEVHSFLLVPAILAPGDLDGNGLVDGSDLSNFASDFASASSIADLNNDNNVDAQDVAAFAAGYGQ